jgi:hypothetical protein
LAQQSPLIHGALQTLIGWRVYMIEQIENDKNGCPVGFLPHTHVQKRELCVCVCVCDIIIDLYSTASTMNGQQPSLHKYRTILEPNNTPFDTRDKTSLPVRRLWAHLIRQEHLMNLFIQFIFRKSTDGNVQNNVCVCVVIYLFIISYS